MWLIFSGDCISSNLGLSLIIHLQGKHWTTMLMPGINDICFFTIIAGKTLLLSQRGWKKNFSLLRVISLAYLLMFVATLMTDISSGMI